MQLNATQYGEIKEVNGENQSPIIILHGLFGSSRNWHFIAAKLSKTHLVYSLDLRNHGQSPHSDIMDYPHMARDVLDFIEQKISQNNFTSINMIAHSMGGKTALWLALNNPQLIEKLVIVDIAPLSYPHDFDNVLNGLQSIPLQTIKSRQDADQYLAKSIKEKSLRQFLLQNLQWKEEKYQWRLNLHAIGQSIPQITGFPDTSDVKPFPKRVLFIGGGQSDYLNKTNQQLTRKLFPYASFSIIKSAGHWLHAEQPKLFQHLIEVYIN